MSPKEPCLEVRVADRGETQGTSCYVCDDPQGLEESERRGWPVWRVVVEAEMPEQRERRLANDMIDTIGGEESYHA